MKEIVKEIIFGKNIENRKNNIFNLCKNIKNNSVTLGKSELKNMSAITVRDVDVNSNVVYVHIWHIPSKELNTVLTSIK